MNAVIKKTIPEWRLACGDLTQMELAALAKLHLSTVAVTESGATRPSVETLEKIAEALSRACGELIEINQIILPPYRGTQRDAQRATRKRRARRARPTHPPKAVDDGSGGSDGDTDDGDPDDGDDPKADARRAA